jgi:hypothetical protein
MDMQPIVTIATAIIGVAILAVLVSKKANTSGVIQAAGTAFSGALNAATSPVTGGQAQSISMPVLGGTQFGAYGGY